MDPESQNDFIGYTIQVPPISQAVPPPHLTGGVPSISQAVENGELDDRHLVAMTPNEGTRPPPCYAYP